MKLSACQTGLGDLVRGDELVGLNRAFPGHMQSYLRYGE